MKIKSLKTLTLLLFCMLLVMPTVASASIIWTFDLPSTGLPSNNPPYPTVATFELSQIGNDVQFVLTPNWNGSGVGFSAQSYIEQIDFVYSGTASSFTFVSGAPVKKFDLGNNANMDSGYTSSATHIIVDFENANNSSDRFTSTYSNSVWTLKNASLSDFTNVSATANNKPSPTQGIISVSAYHLDNLSPDTSNWVTGPVSVPEPSTLFLLCSGLIGLVGFRLRARAKA